MTRCLSCGNWLGTATQNGLALIGCYRCNSWEPVVPHRLEQDSLDGWLTRKCTKCKFDFQYVRNPDERCPPNVCADCFVTKGKKQKKKHMSPRTGRILVRAVA